MKFAHIELLFLFWAVPLLVLAVWYGGRKRRNILRRFSDSRALKRLIPEGIDSRRRLKATLVISALLLLVLAISGPQYGYRWQTVQRRGIDLIIALDCSRSMLADDIQPTRLARAKREIIDLLAMLGGDRVGLVAFSGTAFVQCPLTLDYSAFDLFLNVLTPDYLPVGGTDLNIAIRTALSGFDMENQADKAIILITDGQHTGPGDPQDAAKAARKAGIKLFSIGVGSAQGVPVPTGEGGFKKDAQGQIVLTQLDEPLLTRMAANTGGTYVRSVAGDMDLDLIYRNQIRGRMAQATLESGRKQVWADRYQWPLSLALALLLLAGGIPIVRKTAAGVLLLSLFLGSPGTISAAALQEGYRAYEAGDYDVALQRFADAQLNDPDNPRVLYNLGSAYYKSGNYEAAQTHFNQALSKADPDLRAKILYNLGNTAYRQGAHQEAIQNYEATLKASPQDNQAKENLAFVKKRLEQEKQRQKDQGQSKEQDQAPTSQNTSQDSQAINPQNDSPSRAPSPKQDDKAGQPDQSPQQTTTPPDAPTQAKASQTGASQDQGKEWSSIPPAVADQMLDRLQDEPGRALMPRSKMPQVVKDW